MILANILLKNINCYFQSEVKKIDYKKINGTNFSDGSKKII